MTGDGDGVSRVLRCSRCRSQYTMDTADGFFSFQQGAAGQDRSLLVHEVPASNPHMIAFGWPINATHLRAAVSNFEPQTILDIGCGNGGFYDTLKDLCTSYYGLGPSPIPEVRRCRLRPSQDRTLVHNDPHRSLPVAKGLVDMVLFLASYDHIPNRTEVLREAWRTVKPGRHMLINMTNYGFWAKRLANKICGKRSLRHEEEHFCVHDPRSLTREVCTNLDGAKLVLCDADYMHVPNSPFRMFYRSKTILRVANWLLRVVIHDWLRRSECGSVLICVFHKDT
jgi:SAM-dependent methyltransferase